LDISTYLNQLKHILVYKKNRFENIINFDSSYSGQEQCQHYLKIN